MKILTNVSRLAPTGGIELNVYQVAKELTQRGHAVSVVYREDGEFGQDYRSFCQDVIAVPEFEYGNKRELVGAWRRIRVGLPDARKVRPDAIYAQRFRSMRWAAAVGRSSAAPVVCHVHGFSAHPIGSVNRLFARGMSRMLAVSEHVRQQWEAAGIPGERTEVVYNGIDPAAYPMADEETRAAARAALGIPPDAFVALYCGRIAFEKGIHVLIDAWRTLGLDADGGRLLVAGATESDDYLDELRQRAGHDGVHWLGRQRNVVGPMHAADVTVVPSIGDEAFGRTVIEAMATGCPVIASRVGGIPEVLTEPFDRFLVERSDVDQLAKVLATMTGWRREEPGLAAACRAHVMKRFTLEQMVDGIERALEEAIAGRA